MDLEEVTLGDIDSDELIYPCVILDKPLSEPEVKYFRERFKDCDSIKMYYKENDNYKLVCHVELDINTLMMLSRVFNLSLTLMKSETDSKKLDVNNVKLLEKLISI